MNNILKIGEAVYYLLKGFDNVYPVVAELGVEQSPFIIYQRTSGYNNRTKDYIYTNIVNYQISIASQDYEEGLVLTDKVINKLELTRGNVLDFNISEIKLIDSSETYIENFYIQRISVSIEFTKK